MSNQYPDLPILETVEAEEMETVVGGRHGADDPAGHVRGGGRKKGGKGRGGADDAPNHT